MNQENKTNVPQQSSNSSHPKTAKERTATVNLQPKTDIYESNDGATLYVDLPGVSKESLDLDVDQNVLTIKGSINLDTPENLEATYMDIRSEQFERRFTLGEELDSNRIEAKLDQGELKLYIPKLEQHKPRKIKVNVA